MNMMSSAVGLVFPGFTPYVAAKIADLGSAQGLATELAESGRASSAAGGRADLPR
jgi:NAD(P)-dependent dehydrogenase (short-subunit alcohol dehydrogenase family)